MEVGPLSNINSPQTNKQNMKNTTTAGMLVRIAFNKFNPQRANKKADAEYAARHGTNVNANRTTTRLVPKKFVDPLQKLETEARAAIKHLTSPFEDGGNRFVTAQMVPKLQDTVAKYRQRWDHAVDDFAGEWDKIVEEAKRDLNGDFHKWSAYYPDVEEVRHRFRFEVAFMPLPDHSQLLDSVREQMAEVYEARYNAAAADLRQRLREKLQHLSDRCTTAGDKGTRFYDSNVENVIELCDMLPDMLVQDDQQLLDAIADARKMLVGIDADTIKSSRVVADSVKSQAAAIAGSLL